jgi:hypothetical protein
VDHCDECGFDYGSVGRATVPDALRRLAGTYGQILGAIPPSALRAHPRAGTWSALEYSCHYRDVLRAQRQRVLLAQTEDRPTFASMRREERVLEEGYNEQAPPAVAGELADAAQALAATLAGLDAAGWTRTALYRWPVRAVRTVGWIGCHTVHEGVHHLLDIERLTS